MSNVVWIALDFFLGAACAFALVFWVLRSRLSQARAEADSVLEIARKKAGVEALEAKAKAIREIEDLRKDFERAEQRAELEIEMKLKEIRSHEESLALLDHQLQLRERKVEKESDEARRSRSEVKDLSANMQRTMANLASMDLEEVKESLRVQVGLDCQEELRSLRRDVLERTESDINREAKRTVLAAMQRIAVKSSSVTMASVVQLPSEEMKGRIIGREGRNIKCFEMATGTTLLIDETPGMVTLSGFDPVRREVAKVALEKLVDDGRIHPATIEDTVAEVRADFDQVMENAGDEAVSRLKLASVHPEVVKLLGRLKFRASYSQNVLDHSIEVAILGSIIASELGLDPNVAKRAGLLHDIGKAIDGDYEGSHAAAGAAFVAKHGEDRVVANAVAAHHEEVPAESLYAGVVLLADAISATRPGARSEPMEAYIERLTELEEAATSFPEVSTAYAIQAGREVRVIVDPEMADDQRASALAKEIRQRIEERLEFPSSIRVSVVREQRFTEFAK